MSGIRRPLPRQLAVGQIALQQVTDRVRHQLNRVSDVALVNGVHVGDTELPDAAYVHVKHKLGRKALGWIVTETRNATTGGVINRALSGEEAHDEASTIVLVALGYGATITIRLWVY